MMMHWLSILSSLTSLLGISALVILALAIWKLHLIAPTPVTRCAVIGILVNLGIWLIYGMTWVLNMIPWPGLDAIYRIYEVPYLWEALWGLSTLSLVTALLSLAWTLHRGIRPHEP